MTEEVKVIDNFLPEEQFKELAGFLLPTSENAPDFPWFYRHGKASHGDGSFQFSHLFFEMHDSVLSSNYYAIVQPLLFKISNRNDITGGCLFKRIKANLETIKKKRESDFHWDYYNKEENPKPEKNMRIGIFYINTNNGYTELEDGTKVDSIANRILLFPNTIKHRGVSHTDEDLRCVININYFKEEYNTK